MGATRLRTALRRCALLVAAVALVLVGRWSAPGPAAAPTGSGAGSGSGSGRTGGTGTDYAAGLRAGQAQGLLEGRALQEGAALPAASRRPVQDAFTAGYAAGANDAFNQYDGGWAYAAPYLVTLEKGSGAITYRFASRTPLAPGTAYYLCGDDRRLCTQAHR